MKKNMEIVGIDTPLIEWLSAKLKGASAELNNAVDLVDALDNLQDGVTSSIMLELDEEGKISADTKQIKCGDITIYVNARRVTRGEEDIALTPKEFDILYFLAKNRGEVFTKEQIYQAVWDEEYLLDDSNIMAFIRKIRKKIEVNPDAPEYILTIWGIGYKFNDRI